MVNSHHTTHLILSGGSGHSPSGEESSLHEAIVHIANKLNNDIDDSAIDTTTNVDSRTITGGNSQLCKRTRR